MKRIITVLLILLLVNVVYAQNETNVTSTTIKSNFQFPNLKGVSSFLLSINPILMIIFGIILIISAKLAKFVGIVLIIIAVIHILILFLKI